MEPHLRDAQGLARDDDPFDSPGVAKTSFRAVSARRRIAVARAVMWNSRLVIPDEPPAALASRPRPSRCSKSARAAPRGTCLAVALISHNCTTSSVSDLINRVCASGRNAGLYDLAKDDPEEHRATKSITAGNQTKSPAFTATVGDRRRAPRHRVVRARTYREAHESRSLLQQHRILENIKGGNLGKLAGDHRPSR